MAKIGPHFENEMASALESDIFTFFKALLLQLFYPEAALPTLFRLSSGATQDIIREAAKHGLESRQCSVKESSCSLLPTVFFLSLLPLATY